MQAPLEFFVWRWGGGEGLIEYIQLTYTLSEALFLFIPILNCSDLMFDKKFDIRVKLDGEGSVTAKISHKVTKALFCK